MEAPGAGQVCDIGAFEFSPASPTPTPSPSATPTTTPPTNTPTATPTPTGQTPVPTPTATPTPTGQTQSPTPTPTGGALLIQGNVDCKDGVTAVDALDDLLVTAGLPQLPQQEPCPDVGGPVVAAVIPVGANPWGDVNCDGTVGALDALAILRFVAALPSSAQAEPCTDVGDVIVE